METMNDTGKAEKKYSLVYVDAPWGDQAWTTERFRSLPVERWLAPEALLLMWAPVECLPEKLLLLRCWGFEYAGMLTWRKPRNEAGQISLYGECEYVLVGKRGKAKVRESLLGTVYEAAASVGDYKPIGFRTLLGQAGYAAFREDISRLDMFGAYWKERFHDYRKEYWDFLGEV